MLPGIYNAFEPHFQDKIFQIDKNKNHIQQKECDFYL